MRTEDVLSSMTVLMAAFIKKFPDRFRGDRGMIGPKGERGFVGPQGTRGLLGPQGIPGPEGLMGPIGPQGNDGQRGMAGPDGRQGNEGPIGPAGIRGLKGEKGDKGAKGDKGDAGRDGKDAEFNAQDYALMGGFTPPTIGVNTVANVKQINVVGMAQVTGDANAMQINIEPRVNNLPDQLSLTPNWGTDDQDNQIVTAGAGILNIAAPVGIPQDGQKLILRVQSTNAQTIAWASVYRGCTDLPLPATTSGSGKTDYYGVIWNAGAGRLDLIAKLAGFA